MKQFPKLKEYSDNELIMIVYDDKENWQKEAIIYAKKLLLDRGISEEYSKERIKEIRNEIEILWKQELKERETESYGVLGLAVMTLFWPKYILRDWHLKRDGYHRMRNQRLFAIGIGFLIYFLPVIYATSTDDKKEKERIAEISRIAEQDSVTISKIDWSGKYTFIDSSSQSNEKIIWKLNLIKEQGKHKGILTIKSKEDKKELNCIGLVKNELIEFYPDTTYNLLHGINVSYYDRLFTFGRDSFNIYTQWEKLNPYCREKRKNEEYFKIDNSI